MKVCTYNVNSIRARSELVTRWLEKRTADLDVLCLQELKVVDELFPHHLFQPAGYQCYPFGQKTYNGVAICTRHPLTTVHYGFKDPQWDEQKRLMWGATEMLTIVNVYAPHGDIRGTEKYFYKLRWYERFRDFLNTTFHPDQPLIVAGDFNVALEDKDVYDPDALRDTIGTMPEEREALRSILEWGLIDTFRFLYPDQQQFTWWDYIGGAIWKNAGMRIDYIFCTRPLLPALQEVEVDLWARRRRKPTPSDHAPVIATFDLSQIKTEKP